MRHPPCRRRCSPRSSRTGRCRSTAALWHEWRSTGAGPARSAAMPAYATILGHCSRFQVARRLLDELVVAPRRSGACGRWGLQAWRAAIFSGSIGQPNICNRRRSNRHRPQPCFTAGPRHSNVSIGCLKPQGCWPKARSRFPHHPGLVLLSARLARRNGALEQAERLARQVIGMPESSPDIRCQAGYELGHALDAQDRCAEAYAAFLAAKEIQRPLAQPFESAWRARTRQMRSPGEFADGRRVSALDGAFGRVASPRFSSGLPTLGHYSAREHAGQPSATGLFIRIRCLA